MSADVTTPTSRRALLAGAFGGVAAWAATMAVRANPASAAVGDPVRAGQATTAGGATTALTNNSDSNHTFVVTQNGDSTAIRGDANSGVGGRFKTGGKHKWALIATNAAAGVGTGSAIRANGGVNVGLWAGSEQSNAIEGISANQSGVYGISFMGTGVHAASGGLHALRSDGNAWIDGHVDISDFHTPNAPVAGTARLFVRDAGSGKTELCLLFASGSVQVLGTEP